MVSLQEFAKAVIAYEKKLNRSECVLEAPKLNQELEIKRRILVRSFSIARNMYSSGGGTGQESDLQVGAEFLEVSIYMKSIVLDRIYLFGRPFRVHFTCNLQASTALSLQQEKRLKQMGATVRNASVYKERLTMNEERERLARAIMGKMSISQLSDLISFYHMMGNLCSEALERKLQDRVDEEPDF